MVLITPDKTLYINEQGGAKLAELWQQTYDKNLKKLIPGMVADLLDGMIAVHGVTIMPDA